MYDLLSGFRVVEASSFVASPSAGLYLAQMGAEVIRIDQIGGGPDFRRWPKAENGASLYWEGLNKGKKSVALDLRRPEGRELMVALATAPGDDGGVFLTNFPVSGFLAHELLAARRPDLITVRIMGQADGNPALDYTVNAALGIPQMTGPGTHDDAPVNHVLPAWDLLTGAYAAFAMLAARHHRTATGKGQEIRIPLSDVGLATIGNLGQIAEVITTGANRARYGNEIYGAFGRDFRTVDGERLMLLAITPRQWTGLLTVLDIAPEVAAIEIRLDISFAADEGLRFEHRELLYPLVERAVAQRNAADLGRQLDEHGCCWGPYRTMHDAVMDEVVTGSNPVFSTIEQPSGARYPVPGSMATLPTALRGTPQAAPKLGEHTDEMLARLLGLNSGAIGRLHDSGLIASA